MASPERQIEFLSNLQRLLAEGSFVSTYKYALLLSLGDLCVELGRDDDTPLRIPTRRIGKKFAEYYWRQCRPYRPMGGSDAGMLKQNTGEPPRIIKLLHDVRGAYEDSLVKLRRDEQVCDITTGRLFYCDLAEMGPGAKKRIPCRPQPTPCASPCRAANRDHKPRLGLRGSTLATAADGRVRSEWSAVTSLLFLSGGPWQGLKTQPHVDEHREAHESLLKSLG